MGGEPRSEVGPTANVGKRQAVTAMIVHMVAGPSDGTPRALVGLCGDKVEGFYVRYRHGAELTLGRLCAACLAEREKLERGSAPEADAARSEPG